MLFLNAASREATALSNADPETVEHKENRMNMTS